MRSGWAGGAGRSAGVGGGWQRPRRAGRARRGRCPSVRARRAGPAGTVPQRPRRPGGPGGHGAPNAVAPAQRAGFGGQRRAGGPGRSARSGHGGPARPRSQLRTLIAVTRPRSVYISRPHPDQPLLSRRDFRFSAHFRALVGTFLHRETISVPRKPRDGPRPPSRTPSSQGQAVKGATTAPEPTDGPVRPALDAGAGDEAPPARQWNRREEGNRPPRQGHQRPQG